MKYTVTLRKITVTVLMVVGLMIGKGMKVEAQMLPCVDSLSSLTGLGPTGFSVCACDGNGYVDAMTAILAGVTHFTTDTCAYWPIGHADYKYNRFGHTIQFIDSSYGSSSQSFYFDYGDGMFGSDPNSVHTYSADGYYLTSLQLVDTGMGIVSTTYRMIYVDSTGTTPNFFYTYVTASSANCTANGSATALLYGGAFPFSYVWSNGATDSTITGLSSNSYSVTVTDAVGNTASGFHTVYSVCTNVLEGSVFNDANSNCVMDSGEAPIINASVTANNGNQYYYGSIDANGNYSISIPFPGSYNISVNTWNWGNGSCGGFISCNSWTVSFPSVGDTVSGYNFTTNSSGDHDLGIHVTWSGANPGFQMHYNLYPYDWSYTPFVGLETITFQYDANLVYDSSNNAQVAHNSVTHTLTYVGIGAPNWYFGAPPIVCYFHVPVTLSPNYVVESDFYINPVTNDCDTSNNHLHTSGIVTGSYDPNEKTVTPAGNITSADSVLTYNIHFQNTGNDTTHFVIVTDTLPAALEPTTVVNLASSDPFSEFSLSGNGILKWVFNPLFLPDSASNEPASKGFVMFKVKVKPNLPLGTQINNTASIYFDYNAPVITNTATNSIISGINELTVNGNQLTVYPNPAAEQVTISSNKQVMKNITVTDVLGREIISQHTNSQLSIINCQLLAKGVYFIKMQMLDGSVTVRRFVKE